MEKINPEKKEVIAAGRVLSYDWLVVATGCRSAFEESKVLLGRFTGMYTFAEYDDFRF